MSPYQVQDAAVATFLGLMLVSLLAAVVTGMVDESSGEAAAEKHMKLVDLH